MTEVGSNRTQFISKVNNEHRNQLAKSWWNTTEHGRSDRLTTQEKERDPRSERPSYYAQETKDKITDEATDLLGAGDNKTTVLAAVW